MYVQGHYYTRLHFTYGFMEEYLYAMQLDWWLEQVTEGYSCKLNKTIYRTGQAAQAYAWHMQTLTW